MKSLDQGKDEERLGFNGMYIELDPADMDLVEALGTISGVSPEAFVTRIVSSDLKTIVREVRHVLPAFLEA